MKATAYIRVSTKNQSYDRQLYDFNAYFERMGINPDNVTIVEEKITSHTSFMQRAIYPVLQNSKEGDIIYVCQLDRLGRTVEDIIQLVKYADSLGVELYAIKEGQRITYKTQTGKMMLTLLAMVAEMERELRAERCQSGMDAAIGEIKEHGYRIARSSGNIQTRWGAEKGSDQTKMILEIAREASNKAKQEAAMLWREQSAAYKMVREWSAMGRSRNDMLAELQKLYQHAPEKFCAQKGQCVTRSVLDRWCREMNILVV